MQSCLSKYGFRLLLFAAYVLVVGCSKGDMPFPRCISADYFGPEPTTVGARFASDNKNAFIADDKQLIDHNTNEFNYGFHINQVVRWQDTGLITNGDNLVIRVNGAWTSWAHNNVKESNKDHLDLKKLEQLKYTTQFEGKPGDNSLPDFGLVCSGYESSKENISSNSSTSCSVDCKCINEDSSKNMALRGVPCWFTNGNGVYILFAKNTKDEGSQGESYENPNDTLEHMRYPVSPTVHLGYDSIAEGGDRVFTLDMDSDKIKDRNCNSIKLKDMKGWKIYIKILDRYYFDNAGGYSLEFLSGVNKPGGGTIFDYVYNYLKCTLLIYSDKGCEGYGNDNKSAAAQEMFINISQGQSFHNFVVSLLVLFVVISSLLYLFGMVQETKQDMLIRMMKITLVVVLISPGSFNFFYNHFLILFVDGLEYLIKVITSFSPNANTTTLFSFMGDMFDKFFAYSVWKKFAAFFHYQMWASILMIPAIFVGIVLYFLLCMYAFVIFLSGFIGIAFLIAIMPLFLISILFSQLKSLFEGWIKFCISFCLQSIMIFTLLSLLAAMIMNIFYRQLGFTVCYNKWLEVKLCAPKWLGGFCVMDKEYFSWTPGQIFVPYSIITGGKEASSLNVDKNIEDIGNISREGGTVKFTGGAGYISIPPSYKEKGFRYLDYPFFNPMPDADHYITEKDIIVDDKCDKKDLVRLVNSLSHALDKFDIMLLVHSIDKKIDINSRVTELCAKGNSKCVDYRAIMDDYKKGIVHPDLKREVKAFVQQVITQGGGCRLVTLNEKYKEDGDYQRVQDIKRSILINAKEIFILFLLSFLMFSMRKFVQELGSNLAGGGYSVYSISSMYQGGGILSQITFKIGGQEVSLMKLLEMPKHQIGMKLDVFGKWAGHLPNELAKGAAHLLGRAPVVGGILKYAVEAPRKLVSVSVEATKFITSPKDDVDHFEKKIYKAFGVDEKDITHKKFDRYLSYFKGYVGSHLGYTIEDAVKFTWEHGINSIGHAGSQNKKTKPYTENIAYKDDLLYMAKVHRKEFLDKLYEYTIGKKVMPGKSKADENPYNKPNNAPPNNPLPNNPPSPGSSDKIRRSSLEDAEARRKRAERAERRKRNEELGDVDLSSLFDRNEEIDSDKEE